MGQSHLGDRAKRLPRQVVNMDRQRDLNWYLVLVVILACCECGDCRGINTNVNINDIEDDHEEAIKSFCHEFEGSGAGINNYWYFMNCKPTLKFSDEDVDMESYQEPANFDLEKIAEALTDGDGFYILRNAVSKEDIDMARERVLYHTSPKKHRGTLIKDPTADEKHNNFGGMIWGLLNKGRIFEKIVLHPAVRNVSSLLLGENSQISSLSANTVLPGNKKAQPAHLDYPYYRNLYPSEPKYRDDMMAPIMVLQFVVLLSEFTKENGGTSLRPGSHKKPNYPGDEEDYYRNAIQLQGNPGDIAIFAGSIQHGAMPNKSKMFRSGLLMHTAASYIRPFENIKATLDEKVKSRASEELRQVLGLDHPYPKMHI